MTSQLDRLTSIIRWAVIVWVAYCAIQMVRWWNFNVPALVGGWFWIGSVWSCLLCMISRSPVRRNDWGARIALFAPTLLVMCVFFRGILLEKEIDVGPAWLWPFWNLVLDIAVLTWGWELSQRRRRHVLFVFVLACVGGIAAMFVTDEIKVKIAVLVGGVVTTSITLLRKNHASPRPQGLTLVVAFLAVVDLGLLASMGLDPDNDVDWGLLHTVRIVAQTLIGWRLSGPRRDGMEVVIASECGSWTQVPVRSIQALALCTLIAWTWIACWLYPRCVATSVFLNGNSAYQFKSKDRAPPFLSGYGLLSEIWLASHKGHVWLEVSEVGEHVPEYLFAIQELEEVFVRGKVTDDALKSLSRFPELKSVVLFDATRVTASGLVSLATLSNLKCLVIYQMSGSISDFRCFSSHPQLEIQFLGRLSNAGSDSPTKTQEGIAALSTLRRFCLTTQSICDDTLARQLCEIPSIRTLTFNEIHGITGSTLRRLVASRQLETLVMVIRGVGKSITLAEIAEVADLMPSETILHLTCADVPLVDADLRALKRLEESQANLGSSTDQPPKGRGSYLPLGVSVQVTVEGDDALQQLCAIRSLNFVKTKVRGISEHGLAVLSQYDDWESWSVSFDLTELTCPAHMWTDSIPQELTTQVLITPESIQTDKDVAGLRSFNHQIPRNSMDLENHVHLLCDRPTVTTLERLKEFSFPAQLVVNLADLEMTSDELTQIIEAIPTSEYDIDLRLPRSTLFTEANVGALAALARFEILRLEIDISDSAMPALAKFHGLFEIDLRESNLSPQGLEWLLRCDSLKLIEINPGDHSGELLKLIARSNIDLECIRLFGARLDDDFAEGVKLVVESRKSPEEMRIVVVDPELKGIAFIRIENSYVLVNSEGRNPPQSAFEWPIQFPRQRSKSSE